MEPSGADAYRLGREYRVMPIPMDPARCVEVPAGPLVFVVEGRELTPERVTAHAEALGQLADIDDVSGLDDRGMTVHVLAADDRREHLRFDCFEHEPHYHYLRDVEQLNIVVRIDDVAEGDPAAWALRAMRRRLPEMLAHASVPELGERVRSEGAAVARALDEVERLMAAPVR